jgi:hypothetical protein
MRHQRQQTAFVVVSIKDQLFNAFGYLDIPVIALEKDVSLKTVV